MNLSDLASAVFRTSWQASVLIVIVLGIQRALSSKIPAAWRYVLWLPVVIRLLLPIPPESRLSLFNLFTSTPAPAPHLQVKVRTFSPRFVEESIPDELLPAIQPKPISKRPSAVQLAGGLWLALAASLMLRWILANWRFGRALARSQMVEDKRICAIFDEARRDLSVIRKVSLVEHSMIRSPALFGTIRPRLLLPTRLGDQFCDLELRHIFLHELAHIKRGDLYTNWLLVAMQALHWFNPLVWLACRRMRADREFACDAMALDHANESKPVEFGKTMVKVLETLSGFQPVIGTISVVRNRVELKRRIRMIATYKPVRQTSALWAALLIGICVTGLSNAQTKGERLNSEPMEARKENSATNVIQKNPSEIASLDSPPPVRDEDTEAKDLPRRVLDQRSRLTGAPLLSNRLETIILPEFSVPVETPLSEVIKLLSNEVKENDPKRRGINFLISSQLAARPGPDDPSQVEDFKIKVGPPLKNARVSEVLEAIKNGAVPRGEMPADRLLNYSIEDYAVLLTASGDNTLYTRTFKLNSESFLKAVHNRLQSDHTITPPKPLQDEVREFFAGVGLEFPKSDPVTPNPPRKAVFFNEKTGVLMVRATLGQMDLIEEILHQTQPKAWVFQVNLTMRVIETKRASALSAVEIVSDAIASFSNIPLKWKTNATENSAAVISSIIRDEDLKALLKSLEKRGEYDLMTTHEFTIPSGRETAVSIGGDVESSENKAEVRLIPTVFRDSLALSVGFQWADSGHVQPEADRRNAVRDPNESVDPQGAVYSVNAVGYVTRTVFAATRFSAGETVILSVPRTFRDGRDMLLFITPQNLGAGAVVNHKSGVDHEK